MQLALEVSLEGNLSVEKAVASSCLRRNSHSHNLHLPLVLYRCAPPISQSQQQSPLNFLPKLCFFPQKLQIVSMLQNQFRILSPKCTNKVSSQSQRFSNQGHHFVLLQNSLTFEHLSKVELRACRSNQQSLSIHSELQLVSLLIRTQLNEWAVAFFPNSLVGVSCTFYLRQDEEIVDNYFHYYFLIGNMHTGVVILSKRPCTFDSNLIVFIFNIQQSSQQAAIKMLLAVLMLNTLAFKRIFNIDFVECQNVFLQRFLLQFALLQFRISTPQMDLKEFSFSKALKLATESSRWDDTITVRQIPQNPPLKTTHQPQIGMFQLKHQQWNMFQFQQHIFYFFTSLSTPHSSKQAEFDLLCFSFAVKDGKHNKFSLKGLKGTPSCIGSGMAAYLKQGQKIQNTQSVQNNYDYKMAVLVGLQEGFVKVIQLEIPQSNRKSAIKPSLFSHKLEQKPIVGITVAEKVRYGQKNICFVLLQDSKVFIYNYVSHLVLCIYQPPILSHDHAITLTLHSTANYFATCTKAGQIIIWELTEPALKAIAQSQDKQLKASKKKKNPQQIQQLQNELEQYVWKFKPKDRVISVFPLTAVHAASVDGLKWISFMGSLIALITSTGVFKLIAINVQIRDEYICIIEHQIQDGVSISSAQIFPEEQCIVYFKSYSYIGQKTAEQLQKGRQAESSTFEDLNQKEYLLKNDNYYKANFKTLKHCRAVENVIQKLNFGGDLNISRVTKYQPILNCVILGSKNVETHKALKFISGAVSQSANKIVMCRNDNAFYVGLLDGDNDEDK